MSEAADSGGYAHVRALLIHALGLPNEDWKVRRFDAPYEGWTGSIKQVCDEKGCYCCDPSNLTDDDLAALTAIFPEVEVLDG